MSKGGAIYDTEMGREKAVWLFGPSDEPHVWALARKILAIRARDGHYVSTEDRLVLIQSDSQAYGIPF